MSKEHHSIGLTAGLIESGSDVDPVLLGEGMELIRQEKNETVRESFTYHWRAIAWSVTLSLALVMDGECWFVVHR